MGTASAPGAGETVGPTVSAGPGCAEGVDVDGNSGVGDGTSEAGVVVGSGDAVVAVDAAGGGAGGTVAGGVEACGALVGSLWLAPAVASIVGSAAGASGEHASRIMTRQANRTMPIFVMARAGFQRCPAPQN